MYSSKMFIVQAKSSWLSVFSKTGTFGFCGSNLSNAVFVEVCASGNKSGGFKITILVYSQGQWARPRCWVVKYTVRIETLHGVRICIKLNGQQQEWEKVRPKLADCHPTIFSWLLSRGKRGGL